MTQEQMRNNALGENKFRLEIRRILAVKGMKYLNILQLGVGRLKKPRWLCLGCHYLQLIQHKRGYRNLGFWIKSSESMRVVCESKSICGLVKSVEGGLQAGTSNHGVTHSRHQQSEPQREPRDALLTGPLAPRGSLFKAKWGLLANICTLEKDQTDIPRTI